MIAYVWESKPWDNFSSVVELWLKSQKRAKNCQKKPKLPHRQYGTHFEEDYIPMTNLTIFFHYDLPRKLNLDIVTPYKGSSLDNSARINVRRLILWYVFLLINTQLLAHFSKKMNHSVRVLILIHRQSSGASKKQMCQPRGPTPPIATHR